MSTPISFTGAGAGVNTPGSKTTSFIDFTGAMTGIGGTTNPNLNTGGLSTIQQDAYLTLTNLFATYGLESLAGTIFDYVKKGMSADSISIALQQTPEYKQRFAANEDRKKKGLPVLSPAEYLSTESSYRQLMRQAGLPEGFYDQASDFTSFLAKDVSPTELKSRVDLASQATVLASPQLKDALYQMYGIDDAHITAYFLDPDRAMSSIQKTAAAAQIGAEALKRGLKVSGHAEQYAAAGVSAEQAAQAYGAIAQQLPTYEVLSKQYGMNVNQEALESAVFGAQTPEQQEAANNVNKLASWQRARSQGQAGAAQAGLARRSSGQV
jgi:hypothetical protein